MKVCLHFGCAVTVNYVWQLPESPTMMTISVLKTVNISMLLFLLMRLGIRNVWIEFEIYVGVYIGFVIQ